MRTALVDSLQEAGYFVSAAVDGLEGIGSAMRESPDLILMDVMMPEMDGFCLCRLLREAGKRMPILMLTAKGMIEDRVTGLDAGADDYLVKPFSTEEMLARVRALLRRTPHAANMANTLQLGEIVVDFAKQTCHRRDDNISLTPKELGMLQLLATHSGEAISRERFLDTVWGYHTYVTTRTVDNHMASLRAKLEPHSEEPVYLKTVHRVGYRLDNAT